MNLSVHPREKMEDISLVGFRAMSANVEIIRKILIAVYRRPVL